MKILPYKGHLQNMHSTKFVHIWSATYCTSTVCARGIAGVSSMESEIGNHMQWPQTRVFFAILQREQYFAVSEIALRGRCACNGHASSATVPENSCSCVCQHGTAGQYCEECAAGSQFSLWRRALPDCPFVCQSEYHWGFVHTMQVHYAKHIIGCLGPMEGHCSVVEHSHSCSGYVLYSPTTWN